MYCYQCGAKIPDGSTFCPECGVKLARANKKGNKISAGDTKNDRIIAKAQQLQSGDATAFDELYNLTHDRIYYLALKITQNREDALEAVQETYLSVYRKIGGLANPAVFRAWISKIVVNKCMDLLGKQTEYLALDSREEGEEDIFDRMEESGSDFIPHEALDQEETRNMMMSLIDRLPDLQRITLLLYYYQQLGVNEIAAVMDCPVATVKSRLQYARKQIKQGVEAYEVQGVKLYGFGSGPGLIFALKELAKYNILPSADASHILSLVQHTIARTAPGGGVLSPSGNPAQPPAHVGAPHTGGAHAPIPPKSGFFGKIAHASLSKKIIAGVVTLAFVGTIGFVATNFLHMGNTVGNTNSNLMNEGLTLTNNDTVYYVEFVDSLSKTELRSMDINGGNVKTLYSFDGEIFGLNIDGNHIYFVGDTCDENGNLLRANIYLFDLKDSSVKTLFDPEDIGFTSNSEPTEDDGGDFSSHNPYVQNIFIESDKIFFEFVSYIDDFYGIYSMNLDGSDLTNIVQEEVYSVFDTDAFSVVNSYLFYHYNQAFYRCDLDGNNTTKLYDLGEDSYSSFCIDDGIIYLYESNNEDDVSTIISMDLDGGNKKELAQFEESIGSLHVIDGNIYYVLDRYDDESTSQIYAMNLDGSDQKVLKTSDTEHYQWINAYGDWLYYTVIDGDYRFSSESLDLNLDSNLNLNDDTESEGIGAPTVITDYTDKNESYDQYGELQGHNYTFAKIDSTKPGATALNAELEEYKNKYIKDDIGFYLKIDYRSYVYDDVLTILPLHYDTIVGYSYDGIYYYDYVKDEVLDSATFVQRLNIDVDQLQQGAIDYLYTQGVDSNTISPDGFTLLCLFQNDDGNIILLLDAQEFYPGFYVEYDRDNDTYALTSEINGEDYRCLNY